MSSSDKIKLNGIIDTDCVNRVIKDSVYNKLDKDYELVTVIPLDFIVDDKENNPYPVGLEGSILEIKGIMIIMNLEDL